MKRFYYGIIAAALFAISPAIAQLTQAPFRPDSFSVDQGTKTATATAGAATLAKSAGVVTSEAVTTAAGANYVLTLTNSRVAAADQVFASVANGTNSAGSPVVATVQPAGGSVVITIRNAHASAAFNGTLRVSFLIVKN